MEREREPTERMLLGRRGEEAVAEYLLERGFIVLARNVRVGRLEIDLVALRDGVAVVVEVRTRTPGGLEGPLQSITWKKRARLLRAAERIWRARLSRTAGVDRMRIDVAAVRFEGDRAIVEYVPGAVVGP